MTGPPYVWDARKAAANRRKHRLAFEDAVTVFEDERALSSADVGTPRGEARWLTTGTMADGRVVTVVHGPDADGGTRIISARTATPRERRDYDDEATD